MDLILDLAPFPFIPLRQKAEIRGEGYKLVVNCSIHVVIRYNGRTVKDKLLMMTFYWFKEAAQRKEKENRFRPVWGSWLYPLK